MNPLQSGTYFDLTKTSHPVLFSSELVWNPLKSLKSYLDSLNLDSIEIEISEGITLINPLRIAIGEGTTIESGAYIEGPVWIGKGCTIRHGAYIRPYSIIEDGAIVGHASEIKHSILLNGAAAPHFNYVGDTILGCGVNLGAGVICANFRLDQQPVRIRLGEREIETGLLKFGAAVGDFSQIGCNSVLNPGTLLLPKSLLPPCSTPKHYQLQESELLDADEICETGPLTADPLEGEL